MSCWSSAVALLAVLAASGWASRALAQEAVPMTPDDPGVPPTSPPRDAPAGRRFSEPTLAPGPSKGLLFTGGTMLFASAIQIPIGVGMLKARDNGMNVAGGVQAIAGVTTLVLALPILIVGASRSQRRGPDLDREYALRVGPSGASFRVGF